MKQKKNDSKKNELKSNKAAQQCAMAHKVLNPAYPKFWHNCITNEEQIENPKNIFWESQKTQKSPSIFQKNCV